MGRSPRATPLPALAALGLLSLQAGAQTLPNVIVLLADDVGHGDVGPYDHDNDPSTPAVSNTPVIDALKGAGVVMNHFYATSPVCSPTRAAVLTGRHPIRSGITEVFQPGDPNGLPPDEVTIAELLKPAGYVTGMVGKWHLGDQVQYHPLNQGFDFFYGVPYSNNQTPFYVQLGFETVDPDPDQSLLTQDYTARAKDFISAATAAGQPFFLYLGYTMPHFPVYVSPAFEGATGRGLYADAVYEMDWSVGEILAHLAALGIEGDTLLVFTSDNGACNQDELSAHSGATFRWLCGSNAPFPGFKSTFLEGGLRVPFVATWPGTLPGGVALDTVGSTLDLLPTIAAATGVGLPAGRVIDGADLLGPWIAGAERAVSDLHFYGLFGGNQFGTRELVATRSDQWKQLFDWPGFTPGELFDIVLDPGQTMPLNDPAVTAVIDDLARSFDCALDDPFAPATASVNLARGAPVRASSSLGCDTSTHAVDGSLSTEWQATAGDQWLRADLSSEVFVAEVELVWGALPAVGYAVEVSDDDQLWTAVALEAAGDGGVDRVPVLTQARYVRLHCAQALGAGYGLRELRVRPFAASRVPAPPPLAGVK